MEYAACNVVYVDRTAKEDGLVTRAELNRADQEHSPSNTENVLSRDQGSVGNNLRILLGTFSEVHVCRSGQSCIRKLSELNQSSIVELIPTLVLLDIPYDDHLPARITGEVRTPSPNSKQHVDEPFEENEHHEAYGLSLLQWISTEIQYQSLSRLVVPVAVVSIPEHTNDFSPKRGRTSSRMESQLNYTSFPQTHRRASGLVTPLDQSRTMRYLDIGAVDVLTSPLLADRLPSLAIHAYRAHKDASKEQRALLEMKRGRKRSWVGVDDQKPYAYLREAMVSGLMDGICKLGGDDEPFSHIRISLALDRRERIAAAVGSWQFSAHEFTDDELLHAALLMLQHALAMPELEKWRISTENLTGFLVASRSAYNAFVPYHNFRHVVDVLQAIFHFLVRLGRLPSYPESSKSSHVPPSPIAALIRPFDALTLLITAIGHDVGHPGVNNAFLVTLNAPLAQLYNDRSVLESFHCAAYSQILRRHWPAAFQGVEMRQLMISSILATDMGLHFDYMKRLGFLQEKLHENGGTDGWNGRTLEEQRTLACSLLIKCADISNVARKYHVAAKWTEILTDEFARQAAMEQDLGIPSALFAAPVREIVELGKSQIGFMNMFAIPLFQGVTDVMPGMGFCVDELHQNKLAWEMKIAEEQRKARQDNEDSFMRDGMFSPRSMSMAQPSDASHQKAGGASQPLDSGDLRRALLSKSPFSPTNGVLNETPHHQSLPEIFTNPPTVGEDIMSSPGELAPDHNIPESPKPTQLQLSFATSSAPGLLDQPSKDLNLRNGAPYSNGVVVQHSLVTDSVVIDPQTPQYPAKAQSSEKERSSNGTEGSNSAAGDWTSQATSATTGKMPLSPSTKGTSILSELDHSEKGNGYHTSQSTPTGSANSAGSFAADGTLHGSTKQSNSSDLSYEAHSQGARRRSRSGDRTDTSLNPHGNGSTPKGVVVLEKVKNLRKKPSRFRMNFWKRSKSASPPIPRGRNASGRVLSQEDIRSQ